VVCTAEILGYLLRHFVFALLAFVLSNRIPSLFYAESFYRLFSGRFVYFAYSLLIPFVFGLLFPRLVGLRQRRMLWILTAATVYFGILPFAETVWVRPRLAGLETWREDGGICLQTTDYTCGAAAAVTALALLGVEAEESVLAIASFTTPSRGTSDSLLSVAIESLFADQGIGCRLIWFSSIDQMRDICPVIATVKHRFMIDHYVTVLAVDDDGVTIADPLKGLERVSYDAFGRKWRRVGIAITRCSEDQ